MKKKYDVFVSYRRRGGEYIAKLLYDRLTQLGYQVFLDVDSLRAGDYNMMLYSVIDECKDFLLILTQDSLEQCKNENDWVRIEIEYALEKKLNIIPIIIKGFEFPQDLPPSIDAIRYKSGLQSNYEFFDAFIKRLQNFLLSKPIKHSIIRYFSNGYKILGIVFLLLIVIVIFPKEACNPDPSPTMISNTSSIPQESELSSKKKIDYENLLMQDSGKQGDYEGCVFGKEGLKRSSIVTITFLDTLTDMPEDAWDVSKNQKGFIKAWTKDGDETRQGTKGYDLYIASKGIIVASSCDALFANYNNLTEIKFNHCFYTDKVTSMQRMFDQCNSLVSVDCSDFNTSEVTSMNSMFNGCSSIEKIDISSFNTEQVTDMNYMFGDCSSLKELNVDSFNTSQVTQMDWMFNHCYGLKKLNLSSFDTKNVTSTIAMFQECKSLEEVDLRNFDTSKVTNMSYMFTECRALRNIDTKQIETGQVTQMDLMFNHCQKIKKLDLSNFNTKNVKSMNAMFQECKSLQEIDLGSFDTSQVTNMSFMFSGCRALTNIDMKQVETNQVTDMSCMFANCENIKTLDLSNFDTSKVTNMRDMFYNCRNLEKLNLSSFNTSQVINMSCMFNQCRALKEIDLSNFDMSKVKERDRMFDETDITEKDAGIVK